jgi:S1-C subfamily serine protease
MMLGKPGKRNVIKGTIKSLLVAGCLSLGGSLCARAQVAGGTPAPPAPARPVYVVQSPAAPQVVTVVHRLNGLKVLSLLHRGGQSPMVVGDEFVSTRDMLTSVTAGFVLGDGKSVMARLPQAEAEVEANFLWTPLPPLPAPLPRNATPAAPATPAAATFGYQMPPELQVIQRDGRTRAARYIGFDAGTGLSLIQIEGLNAAPLRDAAEERLVAGQRVRLLAPQQLNATTSGNTPVAAPGKVYLAVGEIEGKITELKRSSNGRLAHLTVEAPRLTSAFAGGIALNETGETIGIIETSDEAIARVMPMALVRRAAERVLARRGNVPQPWLGVRGQAVAATPLAQLTARGWNREEAASLQAKRFGILLTEVAPNTPAALANLRSGDVIVKLNEAEVKGVEDFSFMLNEVGSGATVNFTVLRGEQQPPTPALAPSASVPPARRFELFQPLVVRVKLSESLNPARWIWEAENRSRAASDPLAAAGIETIPLSPKAAARLGASGGGLLVLFVGQETAAARAGLRVFDVIEALDGQTASPSNVAAFFNTNDAAPKTISVIRNHQKFSFSFSFSFSTEETKKP